MSQTYVCDIFYFQDFSLFISIIPITYKLMINRSCPEKSQKSNVSSPIISQMATAHRFSPLGYPGGIETAFSPKINTFLTAERR